MRFTTSVSFESAGKPSPAVGMQRSTNKERDRRTSCLLFLVPRKIYADPDTARMLPIRFYTPAVVGVSAVALESPGSLGLLFPASIREF